MSGILIFGASGHGKVVCDIARARGIQVIGFVDNKIPKGTLVCGLLVLGSNGDLVEIVKQTGCSSGVVAIGDNWIRARVVQQTLEAIPNFTFVSLVHPQAVIASGVSIGAGSVIMAGAVVNSDCTIGDHCIVNSRASMDHDGRIEDFASVAPGVTMGGAVSVGCFSAIGLGANVIHGRTIGSHVVIGAGALLLEDIRDSVVAFGVPCVVIRARTPGERYL